MVKYSVGTPEQVGKIFAALAHPVRRAIVLELGSKKQAIRSVSRLAKPFGMSLPAIMKHIRILEESRLIRCGKLGRTVYCHLHYQTLRIARKWFENFEFWPGL